MASIQKSHLNANPANSALLSMNLGRFLLLFGLVFSIFVPILVFLPELLFMHAFPNILWSPAIAGIIVISIWNRPWAYLAAAILGSLYTFLMSGVYLFGDGQMMLDPRQREFIAAWSVVAATVIWWSGAIVGRRVVKRRAEPTRIGDAFTTRAGTVSVAALAALVALTGTSALSMATVSDVGGGYDFAPASREVIIDETGFPEGITVAQGVVTELVVRNTDVSMHTFTYRNNGQEYSHEIQAGQSSSFLVLFNEAGEVAVRCIPHSDGYGANDGMVTTITVV